MSHARRSGSDVETPVQIGAVDVFGPHRTGDDPLRQQREAEQQGPGVQLIEQRQRWQVVIPGPGAFRLQLALLNEVHDPGTKRHRERRIPEQRQHNMQAQPDVLHGQWQACGTWAPAHRQRLRPGRRVAQ